MLYSTDQIDHNHRLPPIQHYQQTAIADGRAVPITWPPDAKEIDQDLGLVSPEDVRQECQSEAYAQAATALKKLFAWLLQACTVEAVGVRCLAAVATASKDVIAGLPLEKLAGLYGLKHKQDFSRPLRALRKATGLYYSQVGCSADAYREKAKRQHVAAGHSLRHIREDASRRVILVARRKCVAVRLRANKAGQFFLGKYAQTTLRRRLGCGPEHWRVGLAQMLIHPDGAIEFRF